jgi:hypothetical protein
MTTAPPPLLPWEIIEAVIKINVRRYPKLVVLCKAICWGCIRELYRVVELRNLDRASTFLTTLMNNKIPAILIRNRGLRCLEMRQLVEMLYISFDVGENTHWGRYKISFYPRLCKTLPKMSSLQEVDFDIRECSYMGFRQMTRDSLR